MPTIRPTITEIRPNPDDLNLRQLRAELPEIASNGDYGHINARSVHVLRALQDRIDEILRLTQ